MDRTSRRTNTTRVLIALAVLATVATAQEKAPLRIVSPPSETEAHRGQTIQITVAADAPVSLLGIIAENTLGLGKITQTGPLSFALQVPERTPVNQYRVRANGVDAKGQLVVSYPITIDVEPDFDFVMLRSEPQTLFFEGDDNQPVNGQVIGMPLSIIGTSEDGRELEISHSTRTHCRSLNPKVAIPDERNNCMINPVSPGTTTIVVEAPKAVLYIQAEYRDKEGKLPPRNDPAQPKSEEDRTPCPYRIPSGAPCVPASELPNRARPPQP